MKIEEKYVRVGERGQVVIPKALREAEGIRPRQLVRIMGEPGQIVIRKTSHVKEPEDVIFDILGKMKLTDKDWKRIHKQRE